MKGTFSITLVVDPAPLAVAPTEDLGVVGSTIPAGTKLGISGGVPPYVVSNGTGVLPVGVIVSADGTISGTLPAAPGSFPVTFDVADSQG